ncbi:MAG: sensor histidine kinase [Ferruginibacter sp.]
MKIISKIFCKNILLFTIFFFTLMLCNAQSKWSQLEPTLKDSNEVAVLKFYTAAAKDLFFSNRKISEAYANKAYIIATANASYKKEKGDLSNLLGVISMYNEDYDAAEAYLKDAFSIASQLNYELLKIKALSNLALNSSRKGAYQEAIVQIFSLMPLLEKNGDKLSMANNYANLSNAYVYLNQLKNAETYQLKALELFTQIEYKQGISNAYNTLGSIYTSQELFGKALFYLRKSIALKQEAKDSLGIANTYINMADLYKKQNNYLEVLIVLKKAEPLLRSLNDKAGLAKVYNNLGVYYYDIKDFKNAVIYQNKSIKLSHSSGKDQYVLSNAYENIADAYAHLNNPDSALGFSKKALTAKDSLMNLEVQKKITELDIKYQTEKKEKLISAQQLQLKQKELTIVRRNYFIAVTGSLFLLAIAISYFLIKHRNLKNKAHLQQAMLHQQELSTKAILEAEENERIRIAKDLHDGIGQMMSVAKMNLSTIEEELHLDAEKKIKMYHIIDLVDESCKEIRSISHNLMPNALLKAGLAAAVREFINKIDHQSLQIDIHSTGLQERLNADTETVLYRVIQESVNNVIKHSGANYLDVSLINDTDGISVTVEDNGKGFNINEAKRFEGIGLKNMKTRIEYLKGTIEWNTTAGNGTLVAIHIPAKNNIKTT